MNNDELLIPPKEKKVDDGPKQLPLRINVPYPEEKERKKERKKEKRVIIIEI